MATASPDLDLLTFEEVLTDVPPACESVHHGTGHHLAAKHDGPAAWVQIGICKHTTGYRCDKYVQIQLTEAARADEHKRWGCDLCRNSQPVYNYTFIPLSELR